MSEPTREQFVEEVLRLVGQKFPLVKISRAGESFSVQVNGHVASLENLYRIAALNPEDRGRSINRWIVELLRVGEGMPDNRTGFEEVKDRLLPLVVGSKGGVANMAASEPLVEGISIVYGLDNDRTISYLTEDRLRQWNVPPEDIHATAMENLMKRSDTMSAQAAQDDEGRMNLILFQKMDGYDASRILLPNLHEKLREHLGSPFAAAIPNRDVLLCFRNEDEIVERMQPQVEADYARMPHNISDKILLVTADGIALRF